MAVVRYVAFFPPTGFPDRAWHEDAACDALVKSGRRVAEALSREIASRALVGKGSEVRVFVRPAPKGQDFVSVDTHLDFSGGYETAIAFVPSPVVTLAPQTRAEVALDVLLAVLRTLAPKRGWDTEVIDDAAAACRTIGLEYVWHSPWKSDPSRRLEARATFWLEDHGYGRTVLEVRPRRTPQSPVRSAIAVAFCTSAGFQRSAKTLRWKDDAVTMEAEVGLLGSVGRTLRLVPSDGAADVGWVPPAQVGPGSTERPLVHVTGSTYVPEQNEIRYIGGGPTNGVPDTYVCDLSTQFDELSKVGATWWAGADRTLMEVLLCIEEGGDPRVAVRRLKDRVSVRIHRPVGTFSSSNGGRLARDDVNSVIAAVTTRMNLTDPPSL